MRHLHLPAALLVVASLFSTSGFAQRIQNVAYAISTDEKDNVKYAIKYELLAPYTNIPCQVKVKLTTEQNSFYLKEVTGDVGDLVYPGVLKEIIWNHTEELVHFSGDISLEIEVAPSVQVTDKIKKGKLLTVTLAPIYTANKTYAIKLYRAEKEVARLNDVLLIEKTFTVLIPKKTKVKKKYQLAITDGEKTYFSNAFKVKSKIPYSLAIVPLVAIPAYIIINQSIEDNKPLPGPPGIDGN